VLLNDVRLQLILVIVQLQWTAHDAAVGEEWTACSFIWSVWWLPALSRWHLPPHWLVNAAFFCFSTLLLHVLFTHVNNQFTNNAWSCSCTTQDLVFLWNCFRFSFVQFYLTFVWKYWHHSSCYSEFYNLEVNIMNITPLSDVMILMFYSQLMMFKFQACMAALNRSSWPIMPYCWSATVQINRPERNSGQSRTVGVLTGARKDTSALGEVLTSVLLKASLFSHFQCSSVKHQHCLSTMPFYDYIFC